MDNELLKLKPCLECGGKPDAEQNKNFIRVFCKCGKSITESAELDVAFENWNRINMRTEELLKHASKLAVKELELLYKIVRTKLDSQA